MFKALLLIIIIIDQMQGGGQKELAAVKSGQINPKARRSSVLVMTT